MEMVNILFSVPLVLILMLISTLLLRAAEKRRRVSKLRLPPGPARWPIVGNLMQLSLLPHKDMARFCSSYGPLVYLRLGAVDAITTDDPVVVREILVRQDNLFASRPKLVSAFELTYGTRDVAWAPMGPQWKQLRRTCVEHLLTAKRFESFVGSRALEALHLMRDVQEKACNGEMIEVSQVLGAFMMNNVTRMLLGRRYLRVDSPEAAELLSLTHQLFWLLGSVYPGDYLPLWRWLIDPFIGIEKKTREVFQRMDRFLQRIIDEHRQAIEAKNLIDGEHGANRDFIDVLLSLPGEEEKERMDVRDMKGIILDIFTAGSDTSAVATEWAMAEAIKNPKVLERAQEELDRVVGRDRMVRESDLVYLNYLRCIVRETFRMHPPGPLLVPHESTQATELMGYNIPAKTRVFINAHALGRNKRVWGNDADKFRPERHLPTDGERVEILNSTGELEILPFGAGKRKCPGATMGTTMVLLALANLFHGFNWEAPEEIDMEEEFGLTLHKEKPLRAMARPRLVPSLF